MPHNKKEYKKPKLIKHGDLDTLTQAKKTGAIDGDGPGWEAS